MRVPISFCRLCLKEVSLCDLRKEAKTMELGIVSLVLDPEEVYLDMGACESSCHDCQTDNDHSDNKC